MFVLQVSVYDVELLVVHTVVLRHQLALAVATFRGAVQLLTYE